MKIANIDLGERPVLLAPMEDITEPSFRALCKRFGADMVYTEFISSDGLIRDGVKSVKKLDIYQEERPVGIQIYGNELEPMVEAAIIAEKSQPEVIDINWGCPVRKIAARGAGSGMMRFPEKLITITKTIIDEVKLPVTVKTRLGWDNESKNIVAIAEQLQDIGVQALTIHGRTRSQLYKGEADWTLIGEVKNNPRMKIPIIGNGDITSAEIAKEKFDRYGVDGIMVGRATIGKPWIFREIKHYLNHGELLPPPTLPEKVSIAKEQFRDSLKFKGDKKGLFEMRSHFSRYFKSLPHFKEMRLKLVTLTDPDEIYALLDQIAEKYKEY